MSALDRTKLYAIDSEEVDPGRKKRVLPQRLAVSPYGMAATAHYRATEAASQILESGGNAVDAAVAAAFALGVCEPAASGLGGQTMMLVYEAESHRTFALDGSSRAPNRATPDRLNREEQLRGYSATTVPSTPAVLGYALDRHGTFELPAVLEPSIRLAEEGFVVTELQHYLAKRELRSLKRGNAGLLFLKNGEKPYPIGATVQQPVLARTLKRLAREGIEDFYKGHIARQIHQDMQRNHGLLHRDDLAQIPWPIERKPISCRFEGIRLLTFPEPGAGRTLIQMLNILSHIPEKRRNPDRTRGSILLAEVIRRANVDRRDRPFDPNFYPQIDDRRMLSADYAQLVARQVNRRVRSRGETTHLSVMDRYGNVVALTQSIERVYGAFTASPNLGFLYNNYMSAFEYEDITHPYFLRPNAVPWASVAPTIVFKGRRPWAAVGSPGSERITSSILQVLLRLLAGQSPIAAVEAPRLHCALSGKVSLEASRMRNDLPRALERRGYTVDVRDPYSFYLGCVQLVVREKKTFIGAADPRRDGAAAGPEK